MKREEHRISIPILLFAIGELFLVTALFFRGMHKKVPMYATGFVAAILMCAAVVEIVRKNRRKRDKP